MESHAIMPPVSEMMMFKLAEVFSESIPMSIVQINTIFESEDWDVPIAGALFMSVLFVAEAVSYMTYMKDISEESRRSGTIFYGFVPLAGVRLLVVKWSMILLSFCQLLGKSSEMAILWVLGGKKLVFSVLGGEMVVYLIFKVVRGDFRYWMPLPQGFSLVFSLIMRVTVKTVADFTGFVHARHPYEMGGFYWMFNMVLTQAGVFTSIYLLESEDQLGEDDRAERYRTTASGGLFVWCIAIVMLYFGSEKDFRHTFFSLRTSKGYSKALFDSVEDEIKFQIFEDHPNYYAHYEDKIKDWMAENWLRLHEKMPDWLTEELIDLIPVRLLPGGTDPGVLDEVLIKVEKDKKKGGEKKGEKRRKGKFQTFGRHVLAIGNDNGNF